MWSRALTLAAASLIGCLVATTGQAQNLDAGKSAAQLFNGGCSACHKSARGLLKTVSPSALPGFLRQHYTTGTDVAQMLSAYLLSNGATEAGAPRRRGGRADTGSDLRSDAPIGITDPTNGQGERPARRSRHAATGVAEPGGASAGEAAAGKRKLPRKHKRGAPAAAEQSENKSAADEVLATSGVATRSAAERAIDAAVPVPHPVDVPPPSAADIKP